MNDDILNKLSPCKTCGAVPDIFSNFRTKKHIVFCRNSLCANYTSTCCLNDYVHHDSEEKAVNTWNKNKGAANRRRNERWRNAERALNALIRYLYECENVYPEPHYGFEKCIELAKKASDYVSKLYG